ncbi:MAG TPA: hypothetical protein VGW12_20600 [Pyrinomonadaceae bacterium]|nr:hypothetical protein [Pyrinomonadaceae bacterium]
MQVHINQRAIVFCTLAVFILLGFGSTTRAQKCGNYGIFLFVTNKSDKAIKNVRIRLIPEIKWDPTGEFRRDPKDEKLFHFVIGEGTSIPGEYDLLVEAPGFKTHLQKIRFKYCKTQYLTAKLVKGRDPRPAKSQP